MAKKIFLLLAVLMIQFCAAEAASEKILFIPHDNRPISMKQPAEVIEQLHYKVIMPPDELLSQPAELWQWLEENASSASAAVVSSDALLYGGLFESRKHKIPVDKLNARVEKFKALRTKNPDLKIYVFGSLMRTPSFGTEGDIEEPDYYGKFGGDIFTLTALLDKQEDTALDIKELGQLYALTKKLPLEILSDWFERRAKNLSATKKLIAFANDGIVNCFVVGRDDNAPLSQTHRENRQLTAYIESLGVSNTVAQSHAGIDEYAMLLLTRAVNDLRGVCPKVYVEFNRGVGAKTVPAYSDEELGISIDDEISLAGGIKVKNPARADFVLFVNTDRDGKTYHNHNSLPPLNLTPDEEKNLRRNAKHFSSLIEKAIAKNFSVGIADVTFSNGSDNELMNQLRKKNLLYKIHAYSGWNTATNSSGFVVGTGMLTGKMSRTSREKILTRRYLDDWAYQANIRTKIAAELAKLPDGSSIYINLGERTTDIEAHETQLMREFAQKNFPSSKLLKNFTVTNPLRRMFECEIHFEEKK